MKDPLRKRSEQEIAAAVVARLEAGGLDVYQEVTVPGGVADIVALHRVREITHVVEVKTSMSLAALVQARGRRAAANHVWVAVADYQAEHVDIMRDLGLGLLTVRWTYDDKPEVTQHVKAPTLRLGKCKLFDRCEPEHKTHAQAGAVSAAGRWTPYRRTCEGLHAIVAAAGSGGMILAEAVTRLDVAKGHHYQTRAVCLSAVTKWVGSRDVPGVALMPTLPGQPLRVYAFPMEHAHP